MTKFLQGSFSVGETPGLDEDEQQRRWDQTFGKRADPSVATESKPATASLPLKSDWVRTEDFEVYRQALEQILTAALQAQVYAVADRRSSEAFTTIATFAENALAAVKDGAP